MLDIISPVLAASDVSAYPQLDVNWTLVGPIVINCLATIGALAYTFGVVNQKIRAIDRDLERMHVDFERMRERHRDTDMRIHAMSLVLERIATKLDIFLLSANETGACPHLKSDLAKRQQEAST